MENPRNHSACSRLCDKNCRTAALAKYQGTEHRFSFFLCYGVRKRQFAKLHSRTLNWFRNVSGLARDVFLWRFLLRRSSHGCHNTHRSSFSPSRFALCSCERYFGGVAPLFVYSVVDQTAQAWKDIDFSSNTTFRHFFKIGLNHVFIWMLSFGHIFPKNQFRFSAAVRGWG